MRGEIQVLLYSVLLLVSCVVESVNQIKIILPYLNNYSQLYYQVREFTPDLLDTYLRKIPLIGNVLLDNYKK